MQPGDPKVQLLAPVTAGDVAAMPSTLLPTVVIWTCLVAVLLPLPMTKPLPDALPVLPSQLTVGVPVAESVPEMPPVYSAEQLALAQARRVSVAGVQVMVDPLACWISMWWTT